MAAQSLVEMGFSLESSETALTLSDGNVEAALNLLLNGDIPQEGFNQQQSETQATSPILNNPNTPSFAHGCQVIQSEISQFTYPEGRSACTVISCEAAIKLMETSIQVNNVVNMNFSSSFIQQIIQDGIGIYNQLNQVGVEHTATDEIIPLTPRFMNSLKRTSELFVPIQGLLSDPHGFISLFERASQGSDPTKPLAIIITKPPETILVVKSAVSDGRTCTWLLFDSHPRPQFNIHGGYIVEAPTFDHIVTMLTMLFPAVNLDGDLQGSLMAEMYNSVEAVPMQPLQPTTTPIQTPGQPST